LRIREISLDFWGVGEESGDMKIWKFLAVATMLALAGLFFEGRAEAQQGGGDEVAVLLLKVGREKELRRVVIELNPGVAPLTVANFVKLARKRFYNGLAIHRLAPSTLVQMGDPMSRKAGSLLTGTGGPGYTLPPEIVRGKMNLTGAVGMARLSDDINPARLHNGSQFYIALRPIPEYDGKYTVFGRVTEGLEALQDISRLPRDANDQPNDRVVIRALKVVPRAQAGRVK
jgi:cyclophilin family peptidyl-prolyl cis-trans isomerase